MSALYQNDIMQLAKSGAGAGVMDGADVQIARTYNALCGDECTVYLKLNDARIITLTHRTRGCVLCHAAAARLHQLIHTTPTLHTMKQLAQDFETALQHNSALPPPLQMFTPVASRKSRHRCVLLPYQALRTIAEQHTN